VGFFDVGAGAFELQAESAQGVMGEGQAGLDLGTEKKAAGPVWEPAAEVTLPENSR
jgi:hypothetical protein